MNKNKTKYSSLFLRKYAIIKIQNYDFYVATFFNSLFYPFFKLAVHFLHPSFSQKNNGL